MNTEDAIREFLAGAPHAVVGASRDREKYGNKVLRAYQQQNRPVFPVHPKETEIEGLTAYPSLAAVPAALHGISVVTPPAITEGVIEQAAQLGIRYIWLQPGAESDAAVARAQALGINLIAQGPCVLVTLHYHE